MYTTHHLKPFHAERIQSKSYTCMNNEFKIQIHKSCSPPKDLTSRAGLHLRLPLEQIYISNCLFEEEDHLLCQLLTEVELLAP